MRFVALVIAAASASMVQVPTKDIIASLILGARECKTVTTSSLQYATCSRNFCARKCGEDTPEEQMCVTVCSKELEKIESDVTPDADLQGIKKKAKVALMQTGAFDSKVLAKLTVKGRAFALLKEDPSEQELEEVRNADPNAYAIVKALLAKRSLGLLDPKHPSQMRSKPVSIEEEDAAPAEVDVSPAASAHPSAGGWLNWKPASADADEAMVSDLLGQVPGAAIPHEEPAPRAAPIEAVVQAAAPEAAAPAAPASQEDPAAQAATQGGEPDLSWEKPQEGPKRVSALASNSYLASIGGWGSSSPKVQAPPKKVDANPYLNFLK